MSGIISGWEKTPISISHQLAIGDYIPFRKLAAMECW